MDQLKNNNLLDVYAPKAPPIGLLSIPHSGLWIPEEFDNLLISDEYTRNRDVDFAVNKLVDIAALTNAGIAVLVANVHRVAIDLNRSPELCLLNWKNNSHGQQLVVKEPSKSIGDDLIAKYYSPYYQVLKSTIENLHLIHKKVSVIDLHSMPSTPTEYHLKKNPHQKMDRPDFCVSDNHGKTCDKEFIDFTCDQLSTFSNNVTQNDPYIGGHVTQHIDANFPFTNNIQIEIKRALYMDEKKIELLDHAENEFKANLTKAIMEVFKHFRTTRV